MIKLEEGKRISAEMLEKEIRDTCKVIRDLMDLDDSFKENKYSIESIWSAMDDAKYDNLMYMKYLLDLYFAKSGESYTKFVESIDNETYEKSNFYWDDGVDWDELDNLDS